MVRRVSATRRYHIAGHPRGGTLLDVCRNHAHRDETMIQESSDLIESLLETWTQLASMLPRVGVSLLLFLLGWILARAARRVTIKVCRWLKLDVLAERAGVEGFLVQGGVEFTAITLAGGVVYWMVLFLTFAAVLDTLAIPAGRDLVDRFARFIPNVVVVVLIMMFGTVLARVAGTLTYTYLNNIESKAADGIAALARYAVLIFVVAMAIEQLGLRSEVLVSGFQIAFGALCLALALAFGIGGREWAARVLDRFLKR
jgi:uncharacterized membrane protein